MGNSYFYLQAEKNHINNKTITNFENYAYDNKIQIYILNTPLGDNKYTHSYSQCLVLLCPKHKITFIDFNQNQDTEDFEDFIDDFIEDLGIISDKYRYKEIIGRPKKWKDVLTTSIHYTQIHTLDSLFSNIFLSSNEEQKNCELLISLLTGSINNIDIVKATIPENTLDKVKQKIILFDGDQTRFIFQRNTNKITRIQGLSGTGKTELLLHKLKELYTRTNQEKIFFTCHNKILAEKLRTRIPLFFDFMKVEQQILWEERLWCVNAWGSKYDSNSGTYRYICNFYNLNFYSWSKAMPFERACQLAIEELNKKPIERFAFEHILIDESQDFPEVFIELCQLVTKESVYVAGDIFQSIFDSEIITTITPDFLLSKCYRTDPRTLMFAHALGMGLFETRKLRWLDEAEWEKCGYLISNINDTNITLQREPLRRFEDMSTIESMNIIVVPFEDIVHIINGIISTIKNIIIENPTVQPDDIGIILVDTEQSTYYIADVLEQIIPREFNWIVNKSYESKCTIKDTLFVSNKNNVKGLEFPFVICITRKIGDSLFYRNSLYMTLTRSFIKTYLITTDTTSNDILDAITTGLNQINSSNSMTISKPSESEVREIRTRINHTEQNITFYDFLNNIFDDLGIESLADRQQLRAVMSLIGENFNYESVKHMVETSFQTIREIKK